MIVLPFPPRPKPKTLCNSQELLQMQSCVFETLVTLLRKLDPAVRKLFIAETLTVILGVPGLHELPTITLGELMFAILDSCDHPTRLLDMQNVMIFAVHQLEEIMETSDLPSSVRF